MVGAEENTTAKRRQQQRGNSVVVWEGGGAAGWLLLRGAALAATVAVAFVVRAAAKRKKTATRSPPTEAEKENSGNDNASSSEEEVREGLLSLFPRTPPPSPPPIPPPPIPPPPASRILHRQEFVAALPVPVEEELELLMAKEEDDCSSGHDQPTPIYQNPGAVLITGTDDFSATVNGHELMEESRLVQAEEKIIEENTSIEPGQGIEEQDSLPVIINKDVVVQEFKIIQVVRQVLEEVSAHTDGSAVRERDASATVEEGTKESFDETGDSPTEEADAEEVVLTSKAVEPTLPSLRIRKSKRMAVALEQAFHGTGGKPGDGEAEGPVKEKGKEGEATGMVLEALETETMLWESAQVLLLMAAFFLLGALTAWIHHYSKRLLESRHH